MKAILKRFVPIIIIIAIIVLVIFRYFQTKTVFNTTYVNGNSSGNLYNTGLFCQYDDKIYFSNPDDHRKLYVMDKDGKHLKKLNDDIPTYINADEHYLYYAKNNLTDTDQFAFLHVDTNSLVRINRKHPGQIKILDPNPSLNVCLVGNYIYYIHYDEESASTLYRVRIDGKEKEQINKTPLIPACCKERYLYFCGGENNSYIYAYNTDNSARMLYLDYNSYHAIIEGNSVYLIDVENNYRLIRIQYSSKEITVLCPDRVDNFCVSGSHVFYQKNGSDNNDAGVYRVDITGNNNSLLKMGNFKDFNIVNGIFYFVDYNNDSKIYQCSIQSSNVTEFHPGT